jgi:hypothetical protein
MRSTRERSGRARQLYLLLNTGVGLWLANVLVIEVVLVYISSTLWGGAGHRLYQSTLAIVDVPVGLAVLGLLVYWRSRSVRLARQSMVAVCFVWWVVLLVIGLTSPR